MRDQDRTATSRRVKRSRFTHHVSRRVAKSNGRSPTMLILSLQRRIQGWLLLTLELLLASSSGFSATVSPLYSRGYTVIPEPQQVKLAAEDFQFNHDGWHLELGSSVQP